MDNPSANSEGLDHLAESLAREMAAGWKRGERPLAEAFLARCSEFNDDPATALDLIYEEICLRQEHHEPIRQEELFRRFPQWQAQLEKLLKVHDLLKPAVARFPDVGETLGEFRLLAELGRGARGRVYLATQAALADRPVVLKVTPLDGDEHLSLARLQHTHIVPLHTVHDDMDRLLRVLCLPYFGGVTLARLLELLGRTPLAERDGRHLLSLLDREPSHPGVALSSVGPARQWLTRLSYQQAICWIGACLADALDHAHQRGLVHLDVKPSNILLAADGQPMLLDFHLAQPPVAAGATAPPWLGGTPTYMAPELRAALAAAAADLPLPSSVDQRTDIWSLGRVLEEAFARPASESSRIAVGLADILRKCRANDPRDRYQTAAALAADLQRQLTDRPLRGVPNRSLAEHWAKWRRRKPYALPVLLLMLAVLAASVAAGTSAFESWRRQHGEGAAAIEEGRTHLAAGRPAEAVRAFHRGQVATHEGLFLDGLRDQLDTGLRQAEKAQADTERERLVAELHQAADQLRVLLGTNGMTGRASGGRALEARIQNLWGKREDLIRELGDAVRGDLLDLAVLGTDLHIAQAGNLSDRARRKALTVLAEAEQVFGPSHVLFRARQRHAAALGLWTEAHEAERRAAALPPRSAWEHFALGRELLQDRPPLPQVWGLGPGALADGLSQNGRLLAAAIHLNRAIQLQPDGVWAHFAYAACAYRLRRYHDAVASLSVCIGARPRVHEFFVARALAQAALGDSERALEDHHHAFRLGASAAGPPLADIHFNLAVASLARSNPAEARVHLTHALEAQPHHVAATELLRQLKQ